MQGNGRLATVFGGSGFAGRNVVRALARSGWRVRVAVRRPDLAGFLRPLGMVGQIEAVQANVRFPVSLLPALDGADAAINCVGIAAPDGRQSFAAVHVDGAAAIAAACRAAGIGRLIHLSALGADPASPSALLASKGAGEAAIRAEHAEAVIVRPAVLFGPDDTFFNRYAALARALPALPLVGGATRLQPVFAGDVALAVESLLAPGAPANGPYELGGPEIRSMRDLLALLLRVIERRRLLVPVPAGLARIKGAVLQRLPGRLMTADEPRQLGQDNVVSAGASAAGRTLEGLGLTPTPMEAILPAYLWRHRARGQYERRQA